MRPMIEVPPTVSWPRFTFTSASNFSTVCTNLAEARACRPFLLQISSTRVIGAEFGARLPKEESCTRPRSFTRENATGDGDVFAAGVLGRRHRLGERAFVAHFGELDQHRQIDTGEDLDLGPPHHRNGEVGGGTPEHVGEDGHPLAAVHALDGLDDVLAALFHVVVGADGHRLDLLLRPDDMLQSRTELRGEAPVRHEYETDHAVPRRRVPGAPHERGPIMTIRSPYARAFPRTWGQCCIALRGALSAPRQSGCRG